MEDEPKISLHFSIKDAYLNCLLILGTSILRISVLKQMNIKSVSPHKRVKLISKKHLLKQKEVQDISTLLPVMNNFLFKENDVNL